MTESNKNYCQVCGSGDDRCGSCGNMCGFGKNNILRWILGIIIITWIFSIGMKFGELKAGLDRSYGNKLMPMMYGAQGDWVGGGGRMMFTQSVPATVTSGTVQVKSN